MDSTEISFAPQETEPEIIKTIPVKKLRRKYIIIITSLILTAAIIASLFLFVFKEKTEYCLIYTKSDGAYFYRTDIKKSIKFDVKTSNSNERITYYGFTSTDSQKYIYTITDENKKSKLYYRNIGKSCDSVGDLVLVDGNISSAYNDTILFVNKKLFYKNLVKSDLYMYDGNEPIKLAENISDFKVNKTADKVICIDKENNLYQINLGSSAEMIDSKIKSFFCNTDLSHTYYTKDDTLFDKPFKGDKKEIAKGDINLERTYIIENGIYYTVIPDDKKSYYDFVNDPDPSNENFKELRDILKKKNFYINVYYYNNKSTRLIVDHAHEFGRLRETYYNSSIIFDFYYSKVYIDNFEKPNINNIIYTYDTVVNYFYVNIEPDTSNKKSYVELFNKKHHVLVDNKDYELDYLPLVVSPDKKYVYYTKPPQDISFDSYKVEFCRAELNSLSSTEKLIDSNIDYNIITPIENGNVYYTKTPYDLYINGEKVLSMIEMLSYGYEPLITLSDLKDHIGKLTTVKNGKVNIINESVIKYRSPYPKNVNNIFFIEAVNNNNSEGILKQYENGEIIQIDSSVNEIYNIIPIN